MKPFQSISPENPENEGTAEMDAARYRWLRNQSLMWLQDGPICVAADKWGKPITQHPSNDPERGPGTHITIDGAALDAAIDRAIERSLLRHPPHKS